MSKVSNDTCVRISKTPCDVSRINQLREVFFTEFAFMPDFFVSVPGRVNLIGEHVDYCGFPVLPMAIEQSILLAVTTSHDDLIQLKNINPKYKQFKCSINAFKIEVPEKGSPEWHNYFLCGIKGVLEQLSADTNKRGMMILVSGNIPPASGLSSSSALCCSATLATAYVHNLSLNKQNLATISAKCERYIGTQGGGMDQAIAFLAQQGCAQYIEWNPLTATPVALPKDAFFVIANSLAEANKAATSDFNQRVVECSLGCRILAKRLGLSWRDINRFSLLQEAIGCSLQHLDFIIDNHLPLNLYSRFDIIKELNITEDEFQEKLLTVNTKDATEFKLRQRAFHVVQESIRVADFRYSAANGNTNVLSELMRQSHDSLQKLYECSHPNLDRLIQISDDIGIGARLTGAGWGGCIVALCKSTNERNCFIEGLKEVYYNNLPQAKGRDVTEFVFATSPQRGAEIFLDVI